LIASSVGVKKRLDILKIAEEKKIVVIQDISKVKAKINNVLEAKKKAKAKVVDRKKAKDKKQKKVTAEKKDKEAREAKEKAEKGQVVAVGPGRVLDNGNRLEMDVKVGDNIMFKQYAPEEIKVQDETYYVLSQSDVIAIIN